MTVRELIEELENFDDDMEIRIGMKQRYGSDFAYDIEFDIEEHRIHTFFGNDHNAIVITKGTQCGIVDYDDEI